MKFSSSPYGRKIAAVAILAVLLISVYSLLISPTLSSWQNQRDELENLSAKLLRYKELIATGEDINRQHDMLKSQLFESNILSKNAPSAVIAADIQSQIGKIITDLGGIILSTSELPVLEKPPMIRAGVHVNFEGDLPTMVNLLKAIESSKPLMLTDNITIHRPDIQQPDTVVTKLAIGIDVYSYSLEGEP